MSAIELSKKILTAVKKQEQCDDIVNSLEEYSADGLRQELSDDSNRKAFWVNIYNAFSIYILTPQPQIILTQAGRVKHFNTKSINIAGKALSLNDIEHGILRKSKMWWSRGYITKLWVKGFEQEHRVKHFDNRIHFALNCGGESCPPIQFYSPEKIDEQLELATLSFLESETTYDDDNNVYVTSRILKWYSRDFNGKKGIVKLLKKYHIIPQDEKATITYKEYSWEAKVRFMI